MGRRLTNRNNNRYSVTALFSMAAEQDVEVEDDLARGTHNSISVHPPPRRPRYSPETLARPQGENLRPVKEKLCPRTRRSLPRLSDSTPHSEPYGS